MIFKLPYSWLAEYVAVPKDPHDLARDLSLHGVSVERVVPVRHEFTNVIVGQIKAIQPHPNADKLQLVTVEVGKGRSLEIVCGAPNIQVGQKVPVALPGAKLPGGVTVARREVRGVTSNGMLCSARELGIHEDHLGILVLHASSRLGTALVNLGQPQDWLLEVEPTTNRPDLASVVGVAREVGARTGKKLKRKTLQPLPTSKKSSLRITVEDKQGCPRVCAVRVEGVTVGNSPWWMQERLVRSGIRPINSLVDITNYVMLEFGQPMHAYDADVVGPKLTVRRARVGESMVALNGRTYALTNNHLITLGQHGPVDIAGVMGGEASGVTAQTVNVVFKAATWDPVLVRKMSRQLVLSSDASRLFEKGLSTEAPPLAVARAAALARELTGGRVHEGMIDICSRSYRPVVIRFPFTETERLLGVAVPRSTIVGLLKRLGFSLTSTSTVAMVTVPYWREHDVVGPEDIVEEVARLYGYRHIPSRLPAPTLEGIGESNEFLREDILRHRLVAAGFTEVSSYSFIPERWLQALQYPLAKALKVANPLSSDFVYLRPSLLSSLVKIAAENQAHHPEVAIFELAKVYHTALSAGSTSEPLDQYRREELRLCGLLVKPTGADREELFRTAKGVLESLQPYYSFTYTPEDIYPFASGLALKVNAEGEQGSLGILEPAFLKAFGLAATVAAFDAPWGCLTTGGASVKYQPVPRYPAVKRDLALVVPEGINYNALIAALQRASPLLQSVELFDVYRGSSLSAGTMSLALHLEYRAHDRTLAAAEVESAQAALMSAVAKNFQASLRTS